MIISKGWYVTLSSVALCAGSALALADASPDVTQVMPSLKAQLSSAVIHPGERATVELRLAPARNNLANPETPETDPAGEPIIHDELLTQSSQLKLLSKEFKREKGELIWHYDLTAYQSGRAVIPPFAVTLGAESYSSESIPLEITTGRAAGDEELRPEFGRIRPPLPWKLLGEIFLVLAGLAGLGWILRKYFLPYWKRLKNRFQNFEPPIAVRPVENHDEWLREKLNQLRQALESESSTGHLPGLVDDLTGTLRQYFARRNQSDATAWTTPEFQRHLAGDARAMAVSDILANCDVVKFSGNLGLLGPEHLGDLLSQSLEESERVLLRAKP